MALDETQNMSKVVLLHLYVLWAVQIVPNGFSCDNYSVNVK